MTYDLLDPEVQVVICESSAGNTVIEIQDGGCTDIEYLFPVLTYFLVNEFGDLLSPKIRMTSPQAKKLNDWLEAKGVEQRYVEVLQFGEQS